MKSAVIKKMGYVDYYLNCMGLYKLCKISTEYQLDQVRGSGAGSIVAYAIGITDIDPYKIQIYFLKDF